MANNERQIHIRLPEADFKEFELMAEELGLKNGAAKMIKAELQKQAKLKREARLPKQSAAVETKQMKKVPVYDDDGQVSHWAPIDEMETR